MKSILPTRAGGAGPRIRPGERKAINLNRDELVTTDSQEYDGLPFVVRPAMSGVDLVEWAKSHRQRIDELFLEHRALLFRDFTVSSVEIFQSFVQASSSGELLHYKDRSTPRFEVSGRVYVSTIYPPDQKINLHNEGTYWLHWPLKIYFCCLQAAEERGETPICDVREVYERIDPQVREAFEHKKLMYVRNYNHGMGLSWQEAYQTEKREEAEAYFRDNLIEWQWLEGDRLRTRQIRPAVRRHPVTGEKLWFNHGAFFHISTQQPEVREELLASFAEEDLPYNTYYGDGSRIDDDVVAHLREAYDRGKVIFPWRNGDVLMMDNMTVAHAREPYRGDRKIVVAMVDKQSDQEPAQTLAAAANH